MRSLIFALLLVRLQAGAAPITAHGFEIPLAEGWTRTDDPAGAVVLRPAKGPGGGEPDYMLLVLPAQPIVAPGPAEFGEVTQ